MYESRFLQIMHCSSRTCLFLLGTFSLPLCNCVRGDTRATVSGTDLSSSVGSVRWPIRAIQKYLFHYKNKFPVQKYLYSSTKIFIPAQKGISSTKIYFQYKNIYSRTKIYFQYENKFPVQKYISSTKTNLNSIYRILQCKAVKMAESIACLNCSTNLRNTFNFCPQCGTEVVVTEQSLIKYYFSRGF